MSPRRITFSIAVIVLLSAVPVVGDETSEPAKIDQFMRLARSEEGDVTALQTSVVRYQRPTETGTVVDLIGAIHIAEKEYYEQINERFDDYDVVLYELVAPEDAAAPLPGQRSAHPVTAIQVGMKDLLGLRFQLDCVDYRKPNLKRADLTTQEMTESMTRRGESLLQVFFRMMGQGIAAQSKDPTRSSDSRLLAAFFAKDRATQLKRVMAEELERNMAMPSVLDGPDGSTIVTVRNRRAMDELEKQIRAGKKRIAIFYGAAHLPEMADQLKQRFGLLPTRTTWLLAWKIESE
jgi:hypothetical protein